MHRKCPILLTIPHIYHIRIGSYYYARASLGPGHSAQSLTGHHSALDAIRAGIRLWT